ncbi:MAG: hypothetical protein HN675_05295 [Opitutae bacterium]|nr:hypothetical protein [Opitutae bacterium]
MKYSISALAIFLLASLSANAAFRWADTEGKHTDLQFNGKNIARYVYEAMDPKDRERTYKPFHHVYQKDGNGFLTKGPGGRYTHHRGIYYGFSKCRAQNKAGKSVGVDTWHCRGGYLQHKEVLIQEADANQALQKVAIEWRVDDGTVFAIEDRQLTFSFAKDGALVVDFESVLKPTQDKILVDGDPQHAGFQFRASNEVAEKTKGQTYYIRPEGGKDSPGKTKNWPSNKDMTNLLWKAQSLVVGGNRYTTVYLDRPGNPKPSFYSERDYGRFGSYFKREILKDKPLKINYRLNIKSGERTPEECASLSKAFLK